MVVQLPVVPRDDGDVVLEYCAGQVRERLAATLWVETVETTLDYSEERISLHLVLQVLPVAPEVPVKENVVVEFEYQLPQSLRYFPCLDVPGHLLVKFVRVQIIVSLLACHLLSLPCLVQ